ncbi:MAG TPA: DNA-formamidopyrimidine glycosylase family protein [Thermoanaerobaculia bacterium]
MPELPDIVAYVEALEARITGSTLRGIRIRSPFVLRSVEPAPDELAGRAVTRIGRIGKRIVIELAGERFIVLHLMIAGRLRWETAPPRTASRQILALLDFDPGTLVMTEAGSKKRASIELIAGSDALAALDRGGIDPIASPAAAFTARLRSENHTLKRALTDPRLFSGIGNAYSDEILHRARLSPLQLTARMPDDDVARLREATVSVLTEWTDRLRAEAAGGFPEKVTAFRPGMAVHGKFGKPCPACGTPVQRIVYAENETNYCPTCQTGGRLLADRALSRLLHDDWPRSLDEMEERKKV